MESQSISPSPSIVPPEGSLKPILGVLVYLKRDGKTLMLYRNKKERDVHEGKWNGLGGKMEKGETPEEAAIREVHEESGFVVSKMQFKGHIVFPDFADGLDWYVFIFEVYDFSGKQIESDEGELQWIADEEIKNLKLWDGDKLFLDWMRASKGIFSGKITYEGDQVSGSSVDFYP